MKTSPLSPGDAAWFHMDGPSNHAIVMGVVLTRKPLDFERVRRIYVERLAGFDRFHQRVVETGLAMATPQWQDMPRFDIDRHLHHVALPAPQAPGALVRLVDDLASMPLDHSLPLWQAHVVDGVEGGSALVMRCHHCMADGTALMTVIQRLFDPAPGAARRAAPPAARPPAGAGEGGRWFAPALDWLADAARDVAGLAAGAGMLVGELLRPDDPASPMKGEFALGKRVAWSKAVAVRDVKAIGKRHGAKVNDVLVATMTGALRAYLKGRGVDVDHTTLRAMVPVDLRPPERAGQLGNEFGLVLLELPVTVARADRRLAITHERMDALKRSPEPVATKALLGLLGRGPKALEDFSNDLFGRKASLVMTNVVGPREVLYLAGVPIDRLLAWAPNPGQQLGMTISILSYRGAVALTVIGDARLVPDPEAITRAFNREFDRLLKRTTAGAAVSASRPAPAPPARPRSPAPRPRAHPRAPRSAPASTSAR